MWSRHLTSFVAIYLFFGLTLRDEIPSDLDPGLEEGLGHIRDGQTQQVCDFLGHRVVGQRGLVRVAVLFELHRAEQHDSWDDPVDGAEVLVGHSHDVHALDGGLELGGIVHARNDVIVLAEERVRLGVLQDELLCKKISSKLVQK